MSSSPLPSLLLPVIFLLFSCFLPALLSPPLTLFPHCDRTFSCGALRNITYPFAGGDRPEYCGMPGFQLTCRDGYAELNMSSLIYRVLRIDQTGKTLTLSRLDLWNNTCPSPSHLVNSTLDSPVFNYGEGNEDLNLFYGCDNVMTTVQPSNPFHCNVSGNSGYAYYLTGAIPSDPIIKCTISLRIPVLESAADSLTANATTLGEVLTVGFNVNYSNPYDAMCLLCIASSGQCGYDYGKEESICICSNQICQVSASGTNLPRKIAIGVSAAVASVLLALAMLFGFIRRQSLGTRFCLKKQGKDDKKVEEYLRHHGSLAPKRYSYSDIKRMTNSFICKLGQGGYGSLYKGKLSDDRLVAVKVLSELKGNGEEFMNEIASISRTSHVNIVMLLGFCHEGSRRALIYEFMPNGSLDRFISKADIHLEWETLYQIAVGIGRGLEYLHRGCITRILHFDIKPHNILLDEDFCPKISDFGLAKLCQRKESMVSMAQARGTIGYIAPGVFFKNFGGVSHKSDVYSYGMLVLDLVGGIKNRGETCTSENCFPDWLYKHLENNGDIDLILGRVVRQEDEETVRKMILVSLWCIQTNPKERPSIEKVVGMLEGSLPAIETPPKPFLFSPPFSPNQPPTTSLSVPST